MKHKNHLTIIKFILIFISISLFSEQSFGQSLIDIKNKIAGKALIKKITAIDLTYNKDTYTPLAGTSIGLQIEATLKNGKKKWTGPGTKNSIPWGNYKIEVEGGNFYPVNGMLEITDENQVTVTATLISSPTITSKLTIIPQKIKQISVTMKKGVELGEFVLAAKAVLSNNSTISSHPGRLPWEKLDIKVEGANFSSGKISILKNNYRDIKDDKLSVNVKVKGQEDITCSLDIPLNYDEKFETYFIGIAGRIGQTGANGASGANGKAGSGERAGGDGGNGQRAQDGGTGSSGSNAENLEVLIGLDKHKITGKDILKVQIKGLGSGRENYLKIDPAIGELKINAYGGKGGRGGYGGTGGSGGSGGGGSVSGKAGNGGDGGHGGNGGDGGNGGNVNVYVHPLAKKYMKSIVIYAGGGSGGDMGSGGSGGQCPNNCSHGDSGKFGNVGRSGISGKVTITEREVVLDW